MPDRIAFRNIRLRPMACSRPGGHGARINHARPTTRTRTVRVQIGWRALRFCKVPMVPAVATCSFDRLAAGAAPAVSDSLMISLISARWKRTYGSLRTGDVRAAPIGAGRDDAIGDEEAREACLAGKAQIEPDRRNGLVGAGQPFDGALHAQRIQIDVRRYANLLSEQLVEVGSRQARLARDRIELDRLAHTLLKNLDRFAQPEIVDAGEATDGIAAAPGLVEAVFGESQQPIVDRGITLVAIEHRTHLDEAPKDIRNLNSRASKSKCRR